MASISVGPEDEAELQRLYDVALATGADSFIYTVQQEMVTAYIGYLLMHLKALNKPISEEAQ